MPRLRFKNFSDLTFIQRVDMREFMAPLLLPHREYFERQGINVTKLANTDADHQRLHAVFTQPDEEMPADLLEVLYVLDDLADEAGHDRLIAEAERQAIKLTPLLQRDLSPGEFAIAVQLEHPRVVHVSHEKTIFRRIKNYSEFQPKGDRALTLSAAKARTPALEKEMQPWFASKGRSRACEIFIYQEDEEIKFQITHGRPYRTDGSLNKALKRSRVAYRPQQHDSAVFDTETRVLRVNGNQGEKELYRKSIGKILFGDPDHFPDGDLYTLGPLRGAKHPLVTVAGVVSVRLTEVWIELDDVNRFLQISRAHNLLAMVQKHTNPNLEQGQLIRAVFLVKYRSGGRERRLEVRPPNVAIYDRDRDGAAAVDLMHALKLLKPQST